MKKLATILLAAVCLSVLALAGSLLTSTAAPAAPPPASAAADSGFGGQHTTGRTSGCDRDDSSHCAATSPLVVSDVADSLEQSYFANLCETDDPAKKYCVNFLPPTGTPTKVPTLTPHGQQVKLLKIEFISGSCLAPAGDDIQELAVTTTGPSGIPYDVVPVKTFTDSQGGMNYSFSQATKIPAYPGAELDLFVQSANFGGATSSHYQTCTAEITGHLVTQ